MRQILVLLTSVVCAATATAAEYERRLIPVSVVRAPGPYGTLWSTGSTAVQELETGVEIVGDLTLDVPRGKGRSQPYNVFPMPSEGGPPGAILHVRKDVADKVHISTRLYLRQNSVVFQDSAVLPVVSEREFVDHTLYFLRVVNDEDERVHLRVYSLDLNHRNPVVRVRVQASWLATAWHLIYDQVYFLEVRQGERIPGDGGPPFPLRPLAIELSLDSIFDTVPAGADIAVSVLPAAPDLRIWAMLSETNNATQRVRIALPD